MFNNLIPTNQNQQTPTMNSREIANLTGKRHDNVKRTIETLVNQGVIESPQIEGIRTATNTGTVYLFTGEQGKRDSIIIVAQLSPTFTARLVDRWTQLEKQCQTQPMIPQSYSEALQLAADQASQLELAAPKVQFVDKFVTADTLMNATQVAQKHGKSAHWLNKQLEQLDVYNQNVKRGRVFQQWFIVAGYGEMKQTEAGFPQALFTTKGELWINDELNHECFS
ncbi:Rha family transcriptional regulator [Shewanella algae]|uniref:Rha family transcriptional regulator n=1 Tax=Shewanella algae TaxID=38313 RepID=UPI001BED594F|nr:phage antirepressor KilAC domain-containing protein [Shewanella algae]BCV28523.1 DNA-binding protein [Shewanella algae]